jgi:hypothetical protein
MNGTCDATRARLDDLLDGTLDAADRADAEQHLAGCAGCREEHARLRALVGEAAALAVEVAPPVDLWPQIERRIRTSGSGAWTRHLAAAACLALAIAGAISARAPGGGPPQVAGSAPATLQPAALEAADVEQVERDYERAASALLVQLRARQDDLPPETIAQVEESLRTIDTALGQIRAALREQPAEPALHLMLAATHRKKVEVLRRVMEVGA